jgi:hypothetical protein
MQWMSRSGFVVGRSEEVNAWRMKAHNCEELAISVVVDDVVPLGVIRDCGLRN